MQAIRSISVVSPTAAVVIYSCLVIVVVSALVLCSRGRRTAGVVTAIILPLAVFILTVWPRPFPDAIPWYVYASGAGAVFTVIAVLLDSDMRVKLAPVAAVSVLMAYLAVNLVYEQYPTVGSFHPIPVSVSMTVDEFKARTSAPVLDGREVGAMVTLPAAPMRDAVVYVPPAYWHGATLPVLVLLAGSPGSPQRWYVDGEADQALDDYQYEHDGKAPIVVSADGTGTTTGNPACVDGPERDVQTYLAETIPQTVKDNFRVVEDQKNWTIGGLSYGGTCALQVVTNAPESYGSFLDFSGEAEPTLGTHKKTVDELFNGDEEAFQSVNAATLLLRATGTQTYSRIAGKFVAGDHDPDATKALTHLNELARGAGMNTDFQTLPGGHSFQVWRTALRELSLIHI